MSLAPSRADPQPSQIDKETAALMNLHHLFSRLVFVSLICILPLTAHAQLPPQSQRDLLEMQMLESVKKEDHAAYLKQLAEYRAAGGKPGLQMQYFEGVALANTSQPFEAREVLARFIARAGAKHARYAPALELFAKVNPEAKKVEEARNAAARFTAEVEKKCADTKAQAARVMAARKPGTSFRECPFAPEMVIVPGGAFTMGLSGKDPALRNTAAIAVQYSTYPVTIRSLAVGKFEVTHDEWDACVEAGRCQPALAHRWGKGRQPLAVINWSQAQAYLAWLSEVTGAKYRLLSEAEWEYSAQAGAKTAFAFGSHLTTAQANFGGGDYGSPRPVGSYKPNAFGLHDMHGNLWEMTEDCWSRFPYDGPQRSNNSPPSVHADGRPFTTEDCQLRVIRGGSFRGYLSDVHSSNRGSWDTSVHNATVDTGFRVARTLD